MVPGRVYRTRELRAFTSNPSRWAKRLVAQGVLRRPHHGLFYLPLVTGPYVWNALGLGTTQLFGVTLVYNRERTGEVELDERLVHALRSGRFDRERLAEAAAEYARPVVRERLLRAIVASASAA